MSERELVDHYRKGRVFRSTMVWCEGMLEWLSLESVPELLEAIEPVEASSLLEQLLDDVAAPGDSVQARGERSWRDSGLGLQATRRDTVPTGAPGAPGARGASAPQLLEIGDDENTDIDSPPRATPGVVTHGARGSTLDADDEDPEATVIFDPKPYLAGSPTPTDLGPHLARGGEQRARPPPRERLAEMRKARHSGIPDSSDDEKTVVFQPNAHYPPGGGNPPDGASAALVSKRGVESEPPTLRPPGLTLQRPRASVPHQGTYEHESLVPATKGAGAFASDPASVPEMVALPAHTPPRRATEPTTPAPSLASVELDQSMQFDTEQAKRALSRTSPALRMLPAFRRAIRGGGNAPGSESSHSETLTGMRRALRDTQLRQRRSLATVAFGAAVAAAVVTAVLLSRTEPPVGSHSSLAPDGNAARRSKATTAADPAPARPAAEPSPAEARSTRTEPASSQVPSAQVVEALKRSADDALGAPPESPTAERGPSVRGPEVRSVVSSRSRPTAQASGLPSPSLGSSQAAATGTETRKPTKASPSGSTWNARDPGF